MMMHEAVCIGSLTYECNREQTKYNTKDRLTEIDQKKQALAHRKISPLSKIQTGADTNISNPLMKKQTGLTTHLSVAELTVPTEENYENPDLYFGEEAKDNFWDLYKSERKFKDYDAMQDEIHDPRFAYL